MSEKNPICCGHFEKILREFEWFNYDDENGDTILLMPYLTGSDGQKYRVNHCPVCGAHVRDFKIKDSELFT
jgi:hypothetical protein